MTANVERFLLPALLLILLSPPLRAADSDPVIPRFEPDTDSAEGITLEGASWVVEGEDYAVRLQMIDDEQRRAYIQHTTGIGRDPFGAPPGKVPRFISFALEIENQTEGSLSINPRTFWLVTNKAKEIQTPYGLTDLQFSYRVAGNDLPAAYEKVGDTLFENPRILQPGETTGGLLIFRMVSAKTKWMRVDLQLSLPDGDLARITAPYRPVVPEKDEQSAKKQKKKDRKK